MKDGNRRHLQRLVLFAVCAAGLALQSAGARDWLDAPVMSAAGRLFKEMPDDYYTVRPDAASKDIANMATLVLDVREPNEFKTERIPAAQNIPLRDLTKLVDKLPENRAAPIIVYCRTGHRGAIALATLRMAGYTQVRSIAGGLEAWKSAGLALAK